jgi:hypothetical protein
MPLLLRSLPGPTPAQVHFYLLRESLHGIGVKSFDLPMTSGNWKYASVIRRPETHCPTASSSPNMHPLYGLSRFEGQELLAFAAVLFNLSVTFVTLSWRDRKLNGS